MAISTQRCLQLAHGSAQAIQACLDARPLDDQYGYIPSVSLVSPAALLV
jgi:hypothetical protein